MAETRWFKNYRGLCMGKYSPLRRGGIYQPIWFWEKILQGGRGKKDKCAKNKDKRQKINGKLKLQG
jgi:hypothetical protein